MWPHRQAVIATVVKISGIPWFNPAEALGAKAFQDANPDVVTRKPDPPPPMPPKQLQIVEDLETPGNGARRRKERVL
jgi:simple sugar transport system substrate-binding protein